MARLATPAALGALLLASSATLFALDLGGTYALDAARRADASAAVAAAPAAAPAIAASPAMTIQAPATQPAPIPSAARVAAVVPAVRARPASPPRAHRRRPTLVAHAPKRAAPKRPASKRYAPMVAVHPAPRRSTPVVATSHVSPFAPNARPEADLRDVRRFVIAKLAGRHRGLSVISAATYPSGKTVLVTMTVRDGQREWFEKDLVYRNGTALSIEAENQRNLPPVIARNG